MDRLCAQLGCIYHITKTYKTCTWLSFALLIVASLKQKCCYLDDIFITGCIGSGHFKSVTIIPLNDENSVPVIISGPFYWHRLTLIPAWIGNDMSDKTQDEITYQFPNFNGAAVEVWEWICNIIQHFVMDVITWGEIFWFHIIIKHNKVGTTVYPKKYAHGFCFAVLCCGYTLIFPYPSGLLHWHCGNLTIAPVPAKQPWWIWINTSYEFIMNDCITATKQSTTKPCAHFLGYTVCIPWDIL